MTRNAASFYSWLIEQRDRKDEVGRLASEAGRDKTFPREVRRLSLFLHYYSHELENYRAVKIAHSEWRKLRKQEAIRTNGGPDSAAL